MPAVALDTASKCPSCGSRRRKTNDEGVTFCLGCAREYEPFALDVDEQDPLLDATDHTVLCPRCGSHTIVRSRVAPSNDRIVEVCGC